MQMAVVSRQRVLSRKVLAVHFFNAPGTNPCKRVFANHPESHAQHLNALAVGIIVRTGRIGQARSHRARRNEEQQAWDTWKGPDPTRTGPSQMTGKDEQAANPQRT